MRIHLDEQTCPVCGLEHSDHQERERDHWLSWEPSICFKCEDWSDFLIMKLPAISLDKTRAHLERMTPTELYQQRVDRTSD